ncbi:hypothetical protein PQ465_13280 [Sphingobacterium oryzagri]|uniref:Uncharacterized protein n=1 Tax=Sphingobacterium oryzagri TaxID=3025669 RepID=A0ABY7WC85_9SPHI|nr:hypothetical protein [Sphingobacterium sp. KACC 22765]WDF67276.1 hypothetical protein PQ465_13280 [Sphingobacterium sp. KACC 22765]
MEQVTVTTERGIEKTTTLKNGDVLLEISKSDLTEETIPPVQTFYINNELVDRKAYEKRLQTP